MMEVPFRSLLCLGYGYCAHYFKQQAGNFFHEIAGSTTRREKLPYLQAKGVIPLPFPAQDISALKDQLQRTTHLLLSASPQPEIGDPVLAVLKEEIRKAPHLQWVGYLSTTGVYGDHQGRWVDESTPVQPSNERLRRRVEAEQQWLALGREKGCSTMIFRLSGIYGPGRSAIDQMQDGTARRIHKPGQYFSRIHVQDIAQLLLAACHQPVTSGIFNVCDDEPAPSDEVVSYAAQLLGKEPPPLISYAEASLSPMAREFYSSNRRVSNVRIKEQFGVKLAYPTYREGLASIARHASPAHDC